MNDNGESCKEATGKKMEVLNAKSYNRFGPLNAGKMYTTGIVA